MYASESVELKSISDVAHDLGREALFRAVNDKAGSVGTMSRPCAASVRTNAISLQSTFNTRGEGGLFQ